MEHGHGVEVVRVTPVISTSSNNGVGARRSVLVGLERTRKQREPENKERNQDERET